MLAAGPSAHGRDAHAELQQTPRADQTHAMMQDLADHWGLVVVMGIASILLGLLAMFFPGATIVTVAIYFAAWLFVSGIFSWSALRSPATATPGRGS